MKILRNPSSLLTVLALPFLMTQSARADYQSTVLADNPKAYYRLNDDTTRSNTNKNSGSIGAAGNLTNTLALHAIPGAIAGSGNRAQFFVDGGSYGMIPFSSAINPDNTKPFTIEVWFYPSSDQINGGQCSINNRVSSGFPDRTGWVFFQRAQSTDYVGKGGYEGVGWNCRMYRGVGGASGLDVVSQVPMSIGTWQHVVVVYDVIDPVTNSSLTIYINGVAANTNFWTGAFGTDPGYTANPPDTGAALSLGAYNNTSGAGANPYFGGIDEFAFYTNKLTPAQILAHYQNGTNVNRATPYETLIQSANPVVYLRLDEPTAGPDVAVNMGDVRSAGIGTHTAEVRHTTGGALTGRANAGAVAYHNRNGNSTTTIPWLAENNPNAGVPFTFETWIRPMKDQQAGQAPFNNRTAGGTTTGRTGWVVFQRNPNLSYPASEGHGWEFRMYTGSGNGGQDIRTDTDYKIGEWGHWVVTWVPEFDNGDIGNGNNQWQGILTAYFNGVPVNTNASALYAANLNPPEDAGAPSDFAIGSYNARSGLGANPFEGDIGEVAFYTGVVLKPEQILAHYQAGTNANYGTNYESLVLTASYEAAVADDPLQLGVQRLGPKTYLRFNDSSYYPAANSGSLGYTASGELVLTTNTAAGPQSPTYAGFEASNTALSLVNVAGSGITNKQYASLNHPSDLNISGQITLEAWIKPGATQQGDPARIISHGPATKTSFLTALPSPPDGARTNSSEVFLRIDGAANYVVGSTVITYTNDVEFTSNRYAASFAIPGGDLGGANWIHLVGAYDGANWRLYRNGVQVASAAAAVGAVPVNIDDWAIGSTGNGWEENYNGGVDEVAIYDKALSPYQVASHYLIGTAGTTALTIVPAGVGSVTITWPAGTTLRQSSTVNGVYTVVPGSPVSPLTIPASSTTFYRWSLP